MTLCIHRPQRSFDEQWIVEANDLHGLRKDIDGLIAEYGEDGLIETVYFAGMKDLLDTLFCEGGLDSRFDCKRKLLEKMEERRSG